MIARRGAARLLRRHLPADQGHGSARHFARDLRRSDRRCRLRHRARREAGPGLDRNAEQSAAAPRRLADRAARAKAGRRLVCADNTLLTPLRQRPLELGCDLVMHSTTKALNGHSDLFGGALLAKIRRWSRNCNGGPMPPASAPRRWIAGSCLRGLRTLPLRVDRQEATAIRIAEWLAGHAGVGEFYYPDVGFMSASASTAATRPPRPSSKACNSSPWPRHWAASRP